MRAPGNSAPHSRSSRGGPDFVERHGLWTDEQRDAADEVEKVLDSLDLVRVVFADPHGLARSKAMPAEAFRHVLRDGMDFSPGPFVFDTGHAIAVDFFTPGGGVGVDELSGGGDFVLMPDPRTFRVLPHPTARTGWVIGDEYLRSGAPHPLSARRVLRQLCDEFAARGLDYVVGLEVEWYLTRLVDARLDGVGGFGVQGEAPLVQPVDAGYQFNLDTFIDAASPVLEPLTAHLLDLGLPLRTVEHESGPGQFEFTFDPLDGLAAADAMLLVRTATKQVCARLGHHASFMALPGIPGFDPSGWHLHQSVACRSTGRNLFASDDPADVLSELGSGFLAGLLEHADAAAMLCVPTINGYRRLTGRFPLSPARIGWSVENRGAFLRVLGGGGDPATHVENRMGEPCANPYLYLASQLAAGTDGIDRELRLGPPTDDPRDDRVRLLPRSLPDALAAFEACRYYPVILGSPLAKCLAQLKNSEVARCEAWLAGAAQVRQTDVADWEHREYFRNF